VIAQVEWHAQRQPVFRFRGLLVRSEDYIASKGYWTKTRDWTSATGRSYSWDHNVVRLSYARGSEVARYHNKSHGYLGNVHPAYFEISQEALQDLDEIVMTLVYAQGKIQESNGVSFYGAGS
ncbi:hypothetical protein OF83DRAFT_1033414, partial [Amylostereum chailletii]